MSNYGFGTSGVTGGNAYLRGVDILIAEDSEMSRAILRAVLKSLGADRMNFTVNGLQALNAVRSEPVDLVLVDWHMPVLDGIEFVKAVRGMHETTLAFLPIVMVSANSETHHVTEARDAGVNEYLIKPYSVTQLMQRIQNVIENPRPFIRTPEFFGPDRRRRKETTYKGRERRKASPPDEE